MPNDYRFFKSRYNNGVCPHCSLVIKVGDQMVMAYHYKAHASCHQDRELKTSFQAELDCHPAFDPRSLKAAEDAYRESRRKRLG